MQVAAGVFLGGLALWLVQLAPQRFTPNDARHDYLRRLGQFARPLTAASS
jgi:peptidoglycan biosynthesis protein MviN/MurJ (putative lipid II flippase)